MVGWLLHCLSEGQHFAEEAQEVAKTVHMISILQWYRLNYIRVYDIVKINYYTHTFLSNCNL